ncbi:MULTISPECIES: D-Ala-D-Ala carboxypeptidase family metallohydrolase [unclassified Moraxella]|uniref:D-Ala-D-Ala carboxypeptidase family metallohydrolase n=1 Tax=unclassified Moraxella TaxID=2685852 RepID=UPI003AF97B4E
MFLGNGAKSELCQVLPCVACGYDGGKVRKGHIMQITANFSLAELTHSNTAVARGIANTPTEAHKQNLIHACVNLWQPMRDLLGKPVHINSGYRSTAVNKAVGGSPTSAHSIGFAIDFVCPAFGSPREIVQFLATELPKHGIGFDQIILEFPDTDNSWVHIGYKNQAGRQRGQVLTAKKVRGKTVYLQGIQ